MGSLYIDIQVITMRYTLSILICIYITIYVYTPINAANIHNARDTIISRISRQAPSCSSSICVDCLDSCDGCTKCSLCSLVTSACAKGKELKFKGSDVCSKCKYCAGGHDECAKKCKLGKSRSPCTYCIKNCGVRR